MRVQTKTLTLGVVTFFISIMLAQTAAPQSPISEEKKKKLGGFDPADIFPTAREGLREKDKKTQPSVPQMAVKRAAPPPNQGSAPVRPNPQRNSPAPQAVASITASSGTSSESSPSASQQKNETLAAPEVPRENLASANQAMKTDTQPLAEPKTDGGSRQQDNILSLRIIAILFAITLATLIAMIYKLMKLRARIS